MENIDEKLSELKALPILVTSFRRSGTHLLIDTLRKNFPSCKTYKWPHEPVSCLYLSVESLFAPSKVPTTDKKALQILKRCSSPTMKTHLFPDEWKRYRLPSKGVFSLNTSWHDWIENRARHLYIYRDGRDVLTSLQAFMAGFDTRARCDLPTFMRLPIINGVTPPAAWAEHVRRALLQDRYHTLSYEGLVSNSEETINRIGRCIAEQPLGFELPKRQDFSPVNRAIRRVSVRPENTIIDGRARGKALDWRHAICREDGQWFENETNSLLTHLGYENSTNWWESLSNP